MNEENIAESAVTLHTRLSREFVRDPDSLVVAATCDGWKLFVAVDCAPEDYGALCGSKGVMHRALKCLLLQHALSLGYSLNYQLKDSGLGVRPERKPYTPRADWPAVKVAGLVAATCADLFDYAVACEWSHDAVEQKSNLEIKLDAREPERMPDKDLKESLGVVLNAVGRANGRAIYVEGVARRKSEVAA